MKEASPAGQSETHRQARHAHCILLVRIGFLFRFFTSSVRKMPVAEAFAPIHRTDVNTEKHPPMFGQTLIRRVLPCLLSLLIGAGITHLIDKRSEYFRRGTAPSVISGPWGDLQTWDIRLEQPLEYSGFEVMEGGTPGWCFGTRSPADVLQCLRNCGMSQELAAHLVRDCSLPGRAETVIKPDEKTLLSISPDVRSSLYRELAQIPSNKRQASPYCIPGGDVSALFQMKRDSDPKAIALVSKLCYRRNGFTYFSDPEVVYSHLDSAVEREEFKQALTGQNVVMARLLIRPDTDIGKPLNYWGLSMPGVRMKDLRSLLEAQRNLREGGSVSILYFLPPLAREKLFTSPLPPESSSGKMPDCHWTALNYFNQDPDPRMSDNDYASRYISENYYEIAKPGIAGDLVLLLDRQSRVVHSSVYLAADIVFTKNGISYAQPWVLMRERDMIGSFSALDPVKVVYFRRKGI